MFAFTPKAESYLETTPNSTLASVQLPTQPQDSVLAT